MFIQPSPWGIHCLFHSPLLHSPTDPPPRWQENVETLRKALKSEAPPIWTSLQAQLEELLALPSLDANVRLIVQGLMPSFPKARDSRFAK